MPDDVKRRRNNELLAIQNEISETLNQPLLGRTVDILVEGPSKSSRKDAAAGNAKQLTGRTTCDRIVVFEGPESLIGSITTVRIQHTSAFTLFGEVKSVGIGDSGIELVRVEESMPPQSL